MNYKATKYTSLLEAMDDGLCMILETYKGKSGITLNESQANVPEGMMRVTGIAAKIGVKNRNGRIYNEANYAKHLAELQKEIPGGLYGELEHPEGFTINNNNISHKIEAVWLDESTNEIKITILLLDTPKGKIAQSIVKSGGALKVSSRARGHVNKNSEAIIEELITYDIVGTPGFAETELYLSEHKQMVASDMLSESYVVYNTKINNINEQETKLHNRNQMNKQEKNLSLLNQYLKQTKDPGQKSGQVDENYLVNQFAPKLQEWLFEAFAPKIQEWLIDEYAPKVQEWMTESYSASLQEWMINDFAGLFETYMTRKSINESRGKSAISFPTFAKMQMKLYEQQNPQQQDVDYQELTEEEQEALDKLQQGQELDNGEIVLAESAIEKQKQKLQQQKQQEEEDDSQEDDSQEELKEALERKINRINSQLRTKFRSLMESKEDEDVEELNQEISDLQDQVQITQERLDDLDAPENGQVTLAQQQRRQKQQELKQELDDLEYPENGQVTLAERRNRMSQQQTPQQEQKFQQAMQIVADGDELTEEDLEGLNQTQVQEILDSCKTNESQYFPYDDKDEKILESDEELIKELDEKMNQENSIVNLDEEELPTEEEEEGIKESLLEQKSAKLLSSSNSLLESIQKRMEVNGIGKKKLRS